MAFDGSVIEEDQTLAEARALEVGSEVTVQGIVTNVPGAFGNKSIYFEDETAGAMIYTKTLDESIQLGSKIKVIGTTSEYNGQFQIGMTSIELIDVDTHEVTPQVVTATEIGEATEAELVQLSGVVVKSLTADNYGNALLDVEHEGTTVNVKLDSRSGDDFTKLSAEIAVEDIITVTGIVSDYKGAYRLNARSVADFVKGTIVEDQTLEEARGLELGSEVTVTGIVTNTPGAFGNMSIYFEDETAGAMIYTKALDESIQKGSKIKVIGTTSEYKGQFQINMTSIELVDDVTYELEPQVIDETLVGETTEAELVKLESAYIVEMAFDQYDNAYLDLDVNGVTLEAKLDSRSGQGYEDLSQIYEIGDEINVMGIVSDYEGVYRLNLRSLDDVSVIEVPQAEIENFRSCYL